MAFSAIQVETMIPHIDGTRQDKRVIEYLTWDVIIALSRVCAA